MFFSKKIKLYVLPLMIFLFLACLTNVAETEVVDKNNDEINLVIYNRDFGLVNETVKVSLEKGINEFHLEDIPERLEPESVILKSKDDKSNIRILEQKFVSDVLNKNFLLNEYEGQEIKFEIIAHQTGERFLRPGRIIRAGRDPIIEIDGKIRFGLPGEPIFEALPEIKLLKPTLIWNIHSEEKTENIMELSYLTRGFSWTTHYNAIISEDDNYISLFAWFIINNNTGKDFKNANTFLLSGDVGRASQKNQYSAPMMAMARTESVMADDVSMDMLDDYYIFSIDRLIDIPNRETKQIEFFKSEKVPVERVYIYSGQSAQGVQIILKIKNSEENNLGLALPAGNLKVYRKHPTANNIFTGEDSIGRTPVEEEIELNIGKAFDLIGERKTLDSKRIGTRQIEETYQITLRNRKKSDVKIEVIERINRQDWDMMQHSHPYELIDAQQIKFKIDVAAGEEINVEYQVRLKW
jgi:hypothetical protein